MARELGMNPRKFGSLANHKQEPWKLPLPDFIEELFYKRFKKDRPETVRSIEQMVKDQNRKKEERKARKRIALSWCSAISIIYDYSLFPE